MGIRGSIGSISNYCCMNMNVSKKKSLCAVRQDDRPREGQDAEPAVAVRGSNREWSLQQRKEEKKS